MDTNVSMDCLDSGRDSHSLEIRTGSNSGDLELASLLRMSIGTSCFIRLISLVLFLDRRGHSNIKCMGGSTRPPQPRQALPLLAVRAWMSDSSPKEFALRARMLFRWGSLHKCLNRGVSISAKGLMWPDQPCP